MIAPGSPKYNVGFVFELEGDIDPELFEAAIKAVVARHDAFFINYAGCTSDGVPQQAFGGPQSFAVSRVDVSMHDDAEARARACIQTVFAEPLPLSGAVLWRFQWIQVSATRAYWVGCFHHLICDGTSVSLIAMAIYDEYKRLTGGQCDELPSAPPSYQEFIAQDLAYRASSRYEKDRQFWLSRFTQASQPLLGELDLTQQNQSSGQVQWHLERQTYTRMTAVAKSLGCSGPHFLMATLAIYFGRVSDNREKVIIGLAIHNRTDARQKRTVGMFTSQIPVGVHIDPEATFAQTIHGVAAEIRRCYRHQRFPMSEINRHLGIGTRSHSSLFDFTLSFEEFPGDADLEGIRATVIPFHNDDTGQALAIAVCGYEKRKSLLIKFDYAQSLFDEKVMRAHQSRLEILIRAILEHPSGVEQRVSEVVLLGA
ncbi:condensation domain-containing protein, partial [Paraburkholderia aspalathi]|uniref:condensation domain-containing protein n=1 Tax=Paraburkholderia aspalathi TaxID=1324617 RepID=UPI0038BB0253